MGRIGNTIALDSETTMAKVGETPEMVVASAFNGATCYLVKRTRMKAFLEAHYTCQIFGHSISFDFLVFEKLTGMDLRALLETDRIIDVSIVYRLMELALRGVVPHKYSLQLLTETFCGVELPKDEGVRTGFGQFISEDGEVDYKAMPDKFIRYAALDAVVTYRVTERVMMNAVSVPSLDTRLFGHDLQLRAEYALRKMTLRGFCVDRTYLKALEYRVEAEIGETAKILAEFGFVPGQKGNRKAYCEIVSKIEEETGIRLERTGKSGAITQAENKLASMAGQPFIAAFSRNKRLAKKRAFLSHFHTEAGKVHPRYTLLLVTGRVSCSKPNIQQCPREEGFREHLVASEGHVLLIIDYSMIELCTLAQTCLNRYGYSKLAEIINAGVDVHRFVAGQILKKPVETVSDEERRKAKAVNFGLPGGLMAPSLVKYAAASFGVELSLEEAESWREQWLDVFPEMRSYLDPPNTLELLADALDLSSYPRRSRHTFVPAAVLLRIAGGADSTRQGRKFTRAEETWAWRVLKRLPTRRKDVLEAIAKRRGCREIQRELTRIHRVDLPCGRSRARCTWNESRNLPFQGLAANGAKVALYELEKSGYRVVGFVHDEFLIELPEADDYRAPAEDVEAIMVAAMRTVCPDIRIATEYAISRRWSKKATATYDENGRLISWGADSRGPVQNKKTKT